MTVQVPGIRAGWLRTAANGLLASLLAPACAVCHLPLDHPLDGVVCAACWSGLPRFRAPLCGRCGDPLASWRALDGTSGLCPRCRRGRSGVVLAGAIGPYEGPLRAIVHVLKYGGRRSVAAPLARRMRAAAPQVLAGVDVVVPVPLHWRRRRARGFNQAEDLAAALGLPIRRGLRRSRRTVSQTDLPAARRHANVRGAFVVARGAELRGRVVLLVDDVCTTGATLEACARALSDAGVREVRALTAARVAAPPR